MEEKMNFKYLVSLQTGVIKKEYIEDGDGYIRFKNKLYDGYHFYIILKDDAKHFTADQSPHMLIYVRDTEEEALKLLIEMKKGEIRGINDQIKDLNIEIDDISKEIEQIENKIKELK